jgi:hypothetical protein
MREAGEEMRKESVRYSQKHLLYRLVREPSSTIIYRMNQQAWGGEGQAGRPTNQEHVGSNGCDCDSSQLLRLISYIFISDTTNSYYSA